MSPAGAKYSLLEGCRTAGRRHLLWCTKHFGMVSTTLHWLRGCGGFLMEACIQVMVSMMANTVQAALPSGKQQQRLPTAAASAGSVRGTNRMNYPRTKLVVGNGSPDEVDFSKCQPTQPGASETWPWT